METVHAIYTHKYGFIDKLVISFVARYMVPSAFTKADASGQQILSLYRLLVGAALRNSHAIIFLVFTKNAMVSIFLQVAAEFGILALQLALHVGDEEPGDEGASHGETSSDEEHALHALVLVFERVLNGCEDLGTNGGASLAHCGRKTEKVATHRGWEGFSTAEESRDLERISVM